MSVSEQDVRHVAALARVGLSAERIPTLVAELNRILEHMNVLSQVKGGDEDLHSNAGAAMPLRTDDGPQLSLVRPLESFAPSIREGLLLVPRLSTHQDDVGQTA